MDVRLAMFDLDNTLLAGDSDYLWTRYLCQRGIVDAATFEETNTQFYHDYHAGCLDINAFLRFTLQPLRDNHLDDLLRWRAEFIRDCIEPIILPPARALVEQHRAAGDTLIIITATNSFVTRPIAACFDIPHLIATEPEFIENHYTGAVSGEPAFQDGKVTRLQQWLAEHSLSLQHSTFYSDSINDLPLLSIVDHPVAVNPDPRLTAIAQERGWPMLALH